MPLVKGEIIEHALHVQGRERRGGRVAGGDAVVHDSLDNGGSGVGINDEYQRIDRVVLSAVHIVGTVLHVVAEDDGFLGLIKERVRAETEFKVRCQSGIRRVQLVDGAYDVLCPASDGDGAAVIRDRDLSLGRSDGSC